MTSSCNGGWGAGVGREVTLTVAESRLRDAGRKIVRADPAELESIELSFGDIIEIEGELITAARYLPACREDRGRGLLYMDGLQRQNARIGLGEPVRVRCASWSEAQSVTLELSGGSEADAQTRLTVNGWDTLYFCRVLEGQALVTGNHLRVNQFGGRLLEFLVKETDPEGCIVVINSQTQLNFSQSSAKGSRSGITYEDIGGLSREIGRIREMIELPLRCPQVFQRLGIDPPKGVLLYGPPGCGKTLIARAVANETQAGFFFLNGPEVIHKYYGESEARLREIFEKASSNAPSVIFLDEIDAIAAKREDVHGEVEKRVVAQLLALMDGLKDRGQVVVIGATNLPNSLDPALRRPGRFDREIGLPVPDKHGRRDILGIHTRGMPLAGDVDLAELARTTHGFVGADLAALCREAAMNALRRNFPALDWGKRLPSWQDLEELSVNLDDFRLALREVEPSATREVFTEVTDTRWDDVGGLAEVKIKLLEVFDWPLRYPELFDKAGLKPIRGVLLCGPPGTGKSLLARALASRIEANFIAVKGPALLSKWVGESEKGVRDLFRKARQVAPCLVFIDEMDALVPRRGALGQDSGVSDRVVGQFLSEMDGIEQLNGVVVLGATNRPELIDPALLRPGRLDLVLNLDLPSAEERSQILAVHLRGRPLANVDLGSLVVETEDFSGAQLEFLCRQAAFAAVREFIKNKKPGEERSFATGLTLRQEHFRQALENILSSKRIVPLKQAGDHPVSRSPRAGCPGEDLAVR